MRRLRVLLCALCVPGPQAERDGRAAIGLAPAFAKGYLHTARAQLVRRPCRPFWRPFFD
jgi:hypothetical protein